MYPRALRRKPLEGASSETNLKFYAYWEKRIGKMAVVIANNDLQAISIT